MSKRKSGKSSKSVPILAFPVALALAMPVIAVGLFAWRQAGRSARAIAEAVKTVSESYPNGRLLLAPDLSPASLPAVTPQTPPIFQNVKPLGAVSEIGTFPPGQTYLMSASPAREEGLTLVGHFDGCPSVLDRLRACPPSTGVFLFRYLGSVPEIEHAAQLEKDGNPAGAFKSLDQYVKRDPGNFSAWFRYGTVAQKLANVPALVAAYDDLKPYFPADAKVLEFGAAAKSGHH